MTKVITTEKDKYIEQLLAMVGPEDVGKVKTLQDRLPGSSLGPLPKLVRMSPELLKIWLNLPRLPELTGQEVTQLVQQAKVKSSLVTHVGDGHQDWVENTWHTLFQKCGKKYEALFQCDLSHLQEHHVNMVVVYNPVDPGDSGRYSAFSSVSSDIDSINFTVRKLGSDFGNFDVVE